MNRRTALFSTLLLGGLLPRGLLAQGTRARDRDDAGGRRRSPGGGTRVGRRRDNEPTEPEPVAPEAPDEEPEPADFPHQVGQVWRTFDISRYTGLPHSQATSDPQTALIDWIFRRTGSAPWHGEKIAVLGATRS